MDPCNAELFEQKKGVSRTVLNILSATNHTSKQKQVWDEMVLLAEALETGGSLGISLNF